jgi:hypothetical protein
MIAATPAYTARAVFRLLPGTGFNPQNLSKGGVLLIHRCLGTPKIAVPQHIPVNVEMNLPPCNQILESAEFPPVR